MVKRIGFSVAELKYFDVGDILDIAGVIVGDESGERMATQADYDAF